MAHQGARRKAQRPKDSPRRRAHRRLLGGLHYIEDLHALEYATYRRRRSWVLRGVVDSMDE